MRKQNNTFTKDVYKNNIYPFGTLNDALYIRLNIFEVVNYYIKKIINDRLPIYTIIH